MVIGNGLIGCIFSSFTKNDEIIIFASGVSNSKESNKNEFDREEKLLKTTISENPEKKIIYFSTVFIENVKNMYYEHKKNIEEYIKNNCENYLIIRLPQVVGYLGNNNNLFNFLKQKIKNCEVLNIDSLAIRSLIDIDDVYKITKTLITEESNQIINIKGIEDIYVSEIVDEMYNILGGEKKVIYYKGDNKTIILNNSELIDKIINNLYINKTGYTKNLIKKYCLI
jgi:dTDP-4-dehydrorhamnose reductase